jgi:hypothetical protein
MGQVLSIREDYEDHTFLLYNCYSAEKTHVRVDSDKQALQEDMSIFIEWPDSCPFLRSDPSKGRICCTVHLTRPEMCRDFGCWRILILDPNGRRAGRVMGKRHLTDEDPGLYTTWRQHLDQAGDMSDAEWDRDLEVLATRLGYRVMK